jgi:MerR family mercuric resistance operon transcriptional regulator
MNELTIGHLVSAVGVKVSTIRFYECRNLLRPSDRSLSGYRQYSSDSLARLQIISKSKELGFTLDEIADLVALIEDENMGCDVINDRATGKVNIINKKIKALQKIKRTLLDLQSKGPKEGLIEKCPIVGEIKARH